MDFAGPLPTTLLPIKRALRLPCKGQSRFSVFRKPAPAPGWKTKPSWYLVAEQDRMINPKTQCFMADRMGANVRSYAVDHSPMYSEPNRVIDVILESCTGNPISVGLG